MSESVSSSDQYKPQFIVGTSVLFCAFFLSGISGLIYQTVWVRMLTRYLGSTTAATATVLCVFMGGLALGAYGGGWMADKMKRPLRGYVFLEICIAAAAILMSLLIVTVMGGFYINLYPYFGGHPVLLGVVRILFSMACLLLPSILMGATLPLLVSFLTKYKYRFQQGVSRLYSVNTFGAVLGVLITGFILIGEIGERSSLYAAAFLNLLAALLVYRMSRSAPSSFSELSELKNASPSMPAPYNAAVRIWSIIAIFVSGFSALAYEILWTRFLTLPLHTSIYAFSFMLGIFLIGIAVGSGVSGRFRISETRSAALFGLFEILVGVLTAAGMLIFAAFGRASNGFLCSYGFSAFTAFLIVFPVAFIFGWQFPVAVRCCISNASKPGKETGLAYSANTVGAIFGSIIGGFILIPALGTARSFLVLALINIVVGIILLYLSPLAERRRISLIGLALTAVFILMIAVTGDPYKNVIGNRAAAIISPDVQIYAFHEGVAGTTVPAGSPKHRLMKHLFINGVGMTTLVSETKLMAHLPLSLAQDPRRLLVICFGMGTTVRSASRYPANHTIEMHAVDIVPRVFDCFKYYHADAEMIAALPNLHLHADDGRNFLLVQKDHYDVITIDPAPPLHSAGTVNLYTREFFELCKSKLSPDGVLCLWLPPAPLTESIMIMKTFTNTFPGATLWGGLINPGFYLIGGHKSFDQTDQNLGLLAKKMSGIKDIGEWDAVYADERALKNIYLLNSAQFAEFVKNAPEVSDDLPYTEVPPLAGRVEGQGPFHRRRDGKKIRAVKEWVFFRGSSAMNDPDHTHGMTAQRIPAGAVPTSMTAALMALERCGIGLKKTPWTGCDD